MQLFVTLILFGLAFVVLPFGSSWHEIPKVVLFLVAIAGGTTYWAWHGRIRRRVTWVYLPFFALSLFDLIFRWTPTMFFGNPFRMQGVLTLWGLLAWSMLSMQTRALPKQYWIARLAIVTTLGLALIGRLDPSGRFVGSIGEANSLGAFLVFLTPLTHSVLATIPTLIGLIISGSRSALIGLALALGIWLGAKRIPLKHVVVATCFFLLASCFLPFVDTQQDFDYRADIWRTAVSAGSQKPIFGWGIGNIEIGLRAAAENEQTFLRYQYVDSSHNLFLDWWVQGGVIGLLSFITLITLAVRGLIQKRETLLLASFFGILSVMCFNPVSIAILVPFWWIIGKGLAKNSSFSR